MMNKAGIAAVVFVMIAAGLGFAAYFVNKWLTNGSFHLNIERFCDALAGTTVCDEYDESTKLKFNRYLQLCAGPGLAFIAGLLHLLKLCCGTNCCSYLAAFKAFLSCGAFTASAILFCHEHYWTSSERDLFSIGYGLVLVPVAAFFSLLASILMIVSGVQTRNQFGGKVMDAMQIKQTAVTPRRQPRGGRRV